MEFSILLFRKIAVMLLMMLMGFALVKSKLLKSEQSDVLSIINLYVACPCMILSAYQIEYSSESMKGLLIALIAAVAVYILYIFITKPVGKLCKLDCVDQASLMYTNAGNLIVPLISSMLPKEYVFFRSGYIVIQIIMVWVHLPGVLTSSFKVNVKKILLNPSIIAIAVGMVCFVCEFQFPMIVSNAVNAMADSIGPLCMLMIGMLMADVDLKEVFTDPHSYLVCFLRLIVYPLVFILLLWVCRITKSSALAHDVLIVTVLAAAAPIGVAVSQMAMLYNVEAKRAGAICVMSSLLCIISMPVMIYVYQILC